MIREIPASIEIVEEVAVHFSRKPGASGWGVMVGKTRSGKYGVATIAPVMGRPTYNVHTVKGTEGEARKVANAEWTGMGL